MTGPWRRREACKNMDIQKKKLGDWTEISVSGRLDAERAGHLERELEESVRGGEHRICLELARVSFLSSAGIRILVKVYQTLERLGGRLAIMDPSPEVRGVLEMTGLSTTLLAAAPDDRKDARPPEGGENDGQPSSELPAVSVFPLAPGASLSFRLIGDPGCLADASFEPSDAVPIEAVKNRFAFGLGAMGGGAEDLADCFGEFLAVGGSAAYLPTSGGSRVPDYMLAEGSLVPRVRALYAGVLDGSFSQMLRFDVRAGETAVPMSRILGQLFQIDASPAIGWVMVAETAGLIGAALKKSPVLGRRGKADSLFSHPDVRDWISFTPEHAFARSLVLAVGVTSRTEGSEWNSFLRPLRPGGPLRGHAHAAAFDFRALPQGQLPLDETVSALYQDGKILGLLHLISDGREITGSGESLFTRGAVWFGPITSVTRGMPS